MRAWRALFVLALAAWIGYASYYVLSPQPPHSWANDLGYSIVDSGRVAAQATSLPNVAAMIGWETWNDFPSFVYAPRGQDAIGAPLNAFFDPVRAVKFAQVVALTLAFFGMSSLYGAVFGRSRFRWFAGYVYCVVPLSGLLVQWDVAFAWIVALAPWVVRASLLLGRRFGAWALPLTGVLCSAATFGFTPEHGLTIGFPMLILALALYRRERIGLPPLAVAGAIAGWLVFPAYWLLPTRFGSHPMWWTSGVLAEFASDVSGLRTLFGQGPIELIAGVYREQLVSANPSLNVAGSLAFAVSSGTALAVLIAYGARVTGRRALLSRWWPAIGLAALCGLLACGTRLPLLGPWLWGGVIGRVAFLNALRTPDRFIQIWAVLVALASAYGLQRGFEKRGTVRRAVAVAAAVAVVGYTAFFVREGILGFGEEGQLPDFTAVNAAVEQAGGRTAVYAFPLNGSPLDFAAYAPRSSTVAFAWNLMERNSDGDGGLALLRRAAVRSVVTTPNWTQPSIDGIPSDMAEPVGRSPFARVAFRGASGTRVFAIDGARSDVMPVRTVCTYAGPAGFEIAAGQPFLSPAALVHESRAGCERNVLADADPLDLAIPAQAIASWTGGDLFGNLGVPPPDKFEVARMQLTAPWYLNAYGGDSLLGANPLVTDASGSSNVEPFAVPRPGRYSVFVRASGPAGLRAILAEGRAVDATSERLRGFRWVELPLGDLPAGPQTLELSILRFVSLSRKVVIDEVAVAPSTPAIPRMSVDAAIVTAREFAPPGGIDVRAPQYLFPRLSGAAFSADVAGLSVDPTVRVGMINGEPEIRTSQPYNHIRFPFSGRSGDYVASVSAWLAGSGSHAVVSSAGSRIESRYDVTLSPKPADGMLRLRHGEPVDVTLTTGGAGADALTQLVLLPVRSGPERPTEYDERSEAWQFDANYSLAIIEAMRNVSVSMAAGSLRAPAGTAVEIPFHPDVTDGTVGVDLEFSGGSGRAMLRCGSASDAVDVGAGTLNPGSADLLVRRTDDSACALSIEWRTADFQFKFAHIRATGSTLLGWSAMQYFAAGSYRWESAGSRFMVLAIDGVPWKAGDSRKLRSGIHRLTVTRAPAPMPTLRFLRDGAWPLPQPAQASIEQHYATAWSARTQGAATLEIAELNDGNWFARTGGTVKAGYECDLVNTCFDVSGSTDVSIVRRLPAPTSFGLLVTVADVILAAALVLPGRGRDRKLRAVR